MQLHHFHMHALQPIQVMQNNWLFTKGYYKLHLDIYKKENTTHHAVVRVLAEARPKATATSSGQHACRQTAHPEVTPN
jgi:hypothetical protein